jgi:hypothetical protein
MTPLCLNCHGDCCVNKRGSVVDHGSVLALHSCPDCLDGYALDLAAARLAALWDAERENTALRAEVGRLRGERAAVVAWLRACEDESCVFADDIAFTFAAEIERGDHRRGEGE